MQSMNSRFPLPATEFCFAGFAWPRRLAVLPVGQKAKRIARYAGACGPYYHAPTPVNDRADKGIGFYLENAGMPCSRWAWCDEVEGVRIGHNGWYSDEHGDGELIRGVVLRLPSGRGFLAGWSMGKNMASSVGATVYADECEAARAADREAELTAEREREYQAQQEGNE